MSYLGDIRENSFGPNGELWEGDNRIEERHYWNGAFIDLCNLSAEDYAKTIFMTNGSGSSDKPTTKPTNTITVKLLPKANEENMVVYAYQATSNHPVASEYIIELIVEDMFGAKENVTLTIPFGESLSETVLTSIIAGEGMSEPTIINSNYKKEDDEFKYSVILPEKTPDKPMAYHITLKAGELDNITEDELRQRLLASGELDMKNEEESEVFEINMEVVEVEGISDMNISQKVQLLKEHAQDYIIVTDKEIVSIEQANSGINEIGAWQKKDKTITLDNITYTIWYKRDDSQSLLYDPVAKKWYGCIDESGEPLTIEYIIYYK